MPDREPTIRSRELGEGLRVAMEKAGLTGAEVARLLDWSPSWVSRLLTGRRGCTEADVGSFLGICRVRGKERARLMALVHEQNTPGWLQQHGSGLPKQLVTLIDHENKATAISFFQSVIIPGILQTGEYARAIISGNVNVPASEVEDRVAARLARQSLFSRERPARFAFFLHELVLHLPVGGSQVMSDQLHHLLRLSVRPYITLRVVPAALGAYASTAGPFTFMEFADFKPVTYLESETSSLFLEKIDETQAYRNILSALAETALAEGQSRELIGTIATTRYEEHDDQS
ncbi:MAG TPA: helix-turn-helix transcriptional regulator [Actinophytocola sp.]|uniref:helix-turn-helix domain-containing protein n=1 Tax=Actinophytocola sp. TaxID=1872138 RepID=UPI002DB73316|nr:helix-turn-helix transcriptional regulator [Actinophytocola sp.]HEU5469032.1 helix-turn-helix transcriptional regulator [Actinophytocola sp.]